MYPKASVGSTFGWEKVAPSVLSWVLLRVRLSVPVRVTFRVVWKERRRRVLLLVGLRKGSPRESRCTQRLPLGALFDGRK